LIGDGFQKDKNRAPVLVLRALH